jgi:hypothetical protein
MNVDEKIVTRFDELIKEGEKVLATRSNRQMGDHNPFQTHDLNINSQMSHQRGISCINILGRVFGESSVHYQKFDGFYKRFNDYTPVSIAQGILKAAKDDYENGYLFETNVLIRAEVFDSFLDQASYLRKEGYFAPAAVIAGGVLEDALRTLCTRKGIPPPAKSKLDSMNAELAKAGVYNLLVQKRITALADLRNKAAHGLWNEFSAADVEDMMNQVRRFMEQYFN